MIVRPCRVVAGALAGDLGEHRLDRVRGAAAGADQRREAQQVLAGVDRHVLVDDRGVLPHLVVDADREVVDRLVVDPGVEVVPLVDRTRDGEVRRALHHDVLRLAGLGEQVVLRVCRPALAPAGADAGLGVAAPLLRQRLVAALEAGLEPLEPRVGDVDQVGVVHQHPDLHAAGLGAQQGVDRGAGHDVPGHHADAGLGGRVVDGGDDLAEDAVAVRTAPERRVEDHAGLRGVAVRLRERTLAGHQAVRRAGGGGSAVGRAVVGGIRADRAAQGEQARDERERDQEPCRTHEPLLRKRLVVNRDVDAPVHGVSRCPGSPAQAPNGHYNWTGVKPDKSGAPLSRGSGAPS